MSRIRQHCQRQERLEATEEETRAVLPDRRVMSDNMESFTAIAKDMKEFLLQSEFGDQTSVDHRALRQPNTW